MATKATRAEFETRAFDDPYAFMNDEDTRFIAEEMEIIPIDATRSDELPSDMTWTESHIGAGLMSVTDYGRHRNECDTLGDFADMMRNEIADSIATQYLKVMDEDKENVAEKLVAITKKGGYVVVPYFE
jgi:hypothetical protein